MNELSQPCDITAMTAVLLIHPLLLSPSKSPRPSPLETATCQRGSRCTFPTLFCCCLSLPFPKPSAQSWLSFSSVVAVVILYKRMRAVAKVIWHTRTARKTPTHTRIQHALSAAGWRTDNGNAGMQMACGREQMRQAQHGEKKKDHSVLMYARIGISSLSFIWAFHFCQCTLCSCDSSEQIYRVLYLSSFSILF